MSSREVHKIRGSSLMPERKDKLSIRLTENILKEAKESHKMVQ